MAAWLSRLNGILLVNSFSVARRVSTCLMETRTTISGVPVITSTILPGDEIARRRTRARFPSRSLDMIRPTFEYRFHIPLRLVGRKYE